MRYPNLRSGASLLTLTTMLATGMAQAEVPRVVTDIPVTHSLVAMVMGGLGEPVLLLDRGGDPHSFQMRPSQARALSQADLVVWIGPDLTPWLERALASLGGGSVLELLAAEGTERQGYAESRLLGGDEQDHGHEHGDHDDHAGHEHGHGHEHGGHEHHQHDRSPDHGHTHGHAHDHGHSHDHGEVDPHAWLNPHNAEAWITAIAARLGELDPGNAATYSANAQAARARIAALEDELDAILAPARGAGLVTYHDAYGYLATAFGLNLLGTITLGDAADPGAARLGAIRASLAQSDAACLFPEVQHPDAYVTLVRGESAMRVGRPLDPAGVMLDPGPALYESLMRELAQAIADCVAG